METLYYLALIPSDLKRDATIYAIADALTKFDDIISDTFNHLNKRLDKNFNKTSEIARRINIASEKVDHISNMKKAIQVLSPAKYPSESPHHTLRCLFDYKYSIPNKNQPKYRSTPEVYSDTNIKDKLHFYHVKIGNSYKKDHKNGTASVEKMENVGELLIFNTDQSPYFSPFSQMRSIAPSVITKASNICPTSSLSILHHDLTKRESEQFYYAPGIDKVPELETPLDLPDLPGIGEIEDVPGVSETAKNKSPTSIVESSTFDYKQELPDLRHILEATSLNVKSEVQPLSAPPPPPPPMPSMSMVEGKCSKKTLQHRKQKSAEPQSGDARSNLMAAIRQAGGAGKAKLRAASAVVKDVETKIPTIKSKSSGGDLMADLHSKLTMRRKGISGTPTAVDGASMLDRMSALIPEPQPGSDKTSDEDDWE